MEHMIIDKVSIIPESGCWIWEGAIDKNGYGTRRVGPRSDNKNWFAHRLSYTIFVGNIPDGLQINHKCDVPCCVNPTHLYAGTQADNMADTVGKRHYPDRYGDKAFNRKLNSNDVLNIRARRDKGETFVSIHKDYKQVGVTTIRAACNGQNWTML